MTAYGRVVALQPRRLVDGTWLAVRARRLNATAVTLRRRSKRLSRRARGYELVVHAAGWDGVIWLDAGETEAMMWRQLMRPVCVARCPVDAAASAPELPSLWRYRDVWYVAAGDARASTILHAVEQAERADRPRTVAGSGLVSRLDAGAALPREATIPFPYVGRLVWKRFLFELTECARLEQSRDPARDGPTYLHRRADGHRSRRLPRGGPIRGLHRAPACQVRRPVGWRLVTSWRAGARDVGPPANVMSTVP